MNETSGALFFTLSLLKNVARLQWKWEILVSLSKPLEQTLQEMSVFTLIICAVVLHTSFYDNLASCGD